MDLVSVSVHEPACEFQLRLWIPREKLLQRSWWNPPQEVLALRSWRCFALICTALHCFALVLVWKFCRDSHRNFLHGQVVFKVRVWRSFKVLVWVRSWWLDKALFLVPKQVHAAAIMIMSNLVCYCSIATVARIWYIDILPPESLALAGVFFWGISHDINHPAIVVPPWLRNPPYVATCFSWPWHCRSQVLEDSHVLEMALCAVAAPCAGAALDLAAWQKCTLW